jgi:cysteine-rich repeat protein
VRKGAAFSFAIVGLFVASPASAANIFTDNFATGNFSQWTQVDTEGAAGRWQISTVKSLLPYSGHAIGGTGTAGKILRKQVPTDTYTDVFFSFHYKTSSFDYDTKKKDIDRVFVEYTTDGTTWTLLKEINTKTFAQDKMILDIEREETGWRKAVSTVPAHPDFQFRLRAVLGDSGDRFWVDAVSVGGTPMENTPDRCDDGMDNDVDRLTDESEPECADFYSTLTVVKTGTGEGAVTSSPFGIDCGFDCVEAYIKDTFVTLTNAVTRGFVFAGWSGACSGLGDCEVSMEEEREVIATFDALTPYTLTVANDSSDGGKITGTGIDCGADCTEMIYEGEASEGETWAITATANPGFEFTGWSGDCSGTDADCELTKDADKSATANYTALAPSICGNAVVEWDEQCDDGNQIGSEVDGCSILCMAPTISCTGTVSYPICQIVYP